MAALSPLRSAGALVTVFLAATSIPAQSSGFGYVEYGTGCGPAPVPRLSAPEGPRIAQMFRLEITNLRRFRTGVVFVGVSGTQWAGQPLPLALDPAGFVGCSVYASGELMVPFAASETFTWNVRIPNNPALVGGAIYNQALIVEPLTPGGLVASNAGRGTVMSSQLRVFDEGFVNDDMMDMAASSWTWANGRATPGTIGDSGVLGDFDITQGAFITSNLYEWSTDNQVILASDTLTGEQIVVTDGVFRFANFDLPAGMTVRFVGSRPARIIVRGTASIDGVIDAGAVDPIPHSVTLPTGRPNPVGQPGGAGGPGGGSGGAGADMGDGTQALTAFDGQDGDDVQLMAGHAYAGRAAGTGGGGSQQFPLDGLDSSVTFNGVAFLFSAQITAGGGGGGLLTPGTNGTVAQTTCTPCSQPQPWPGRHRGPRARLVPGPGRREHARPLLGRRIRRRRWRAATRSSRRGPPSCGNPESAGAGGGGAVGLRVGRDLRMGTGGRIDVDGGTPSENRSAPPPAPGGGGSGGSCVMQVGASVDLRGLIDASGGDGGFHLQSEPDLPHRYPRRRRQPRQPPPRERECGTAALRFGRHGTGRDSGEHGAVDRERHHRRLSLQVVRGRRAAAEHVVALRGDRDGRRGSDRVQR